MKKKTKLSLIAIMAVIIGTVPVMNIETNAIASKHKEVRWLNITKGMKLMKRNKKPALIFFHTDWCHYCSKMEEETFDAPQITSYLKRNFITIKVNPEKETQKIKIKTIKQKITPMELFRSAGGRGFPTVLFFDKKGIPLTIAPGYVDKKNFLAFIKYINKGCYKKKIPFRDYMNNPGICKKN